MNNTLCFTGSNPQGYKAQILSVPNEGYSLFTWFDSDTTVLIMWNEKTWFNMGLGIFSGRRTFKFKEGILK